MQDILWLTEWVLAMSTWICHMATKRKEWSRRALCVGNQNKPVRAYGCTELTKSLWAIKSLHFRQNIHVKAVEAAPSKKKQKKRGNLRGNYEMRPLFSALVRLRAQRSAAHRSRRATARVWLLSIKGKLASMTCWMVCFNRRGQLQRLVVFFFQLWQVASTPGVSTAG